MCFFHLLSYYLPIYVTITVIFMILKKNSPTISVPAYCCHSQFFFYSSRIGNGIQSFFVILCRLLLPSNCKDFTDVPPPDDCPKIFLSSSSWKLDHYNDWSDWTEAGRFCLVMKHTACWLELHQLISHRMRLANNEDLVVSIARCSFNAGFSWG